MPHITVEYSGSLAEGFERPALAKELHETTVTLAGGRAGGCKTRFLRLDDTFIADGSPHYAMIHVEIALLSGRTPEIKHALAGAALELVRAHTAPHPRFEVQFSVEVRDLDRETYVRHEDPRTQE